MSASSVPPIAFAESGLIIPEETDILAGVQADMNAAFGGGLNPALETPQGQLASSAAAVIADKNAEFALLVNNMDPRYSSGRFQDGIGRIYFLTRKPATSTSVACTLTGAIGATIPAGTLAQDTNDNTYYLTGDATIGPSGTVVAEFQNVESGPIPCAIGTLTQVYQAVAGWDAITNLAAGVLGNNVETPQEFEYRRKNSVALNSRGTPQSIYAAVFNVDNVLDAYVLDNPLDTAQTFGVTNYELQPHSVYVAVVGGIDAEIAAAIWSKKDVGCGYNGNTTVPVSDPSGYSYPVPSYNVIFNRPDEVAIKFKVEILNDPSLPSDIVAQIKAATIARFYGTDGSQRERIGATILHSRYYPALTPLGSIVEIMVGTVTATLAKIEIGIDQTPTLDDADIEVVLI